MFLLKKDGGMDVGRHPLVSTMFPMQFYNPHLSQLVCLKNSPSNSYKYWPHPSHEFIAFTGRMYHNLVNLSPLGGNLSPSILQCSEQCCDEYSCTITWTAFPIIAVEENAQNKIVA